VVDCIGEMLNNNQELLKSQVNTQILQLVQEALCEQHYNALCGSRFMMMLRLCCSCYGEPHCPNQNQVLVNCIAPLKAKQEQLLPQLRISESGDVHISAPLRNRNDSSSRYDWQSVRWISISDFQVTNAISLTLTILSHSH